VDRVELERILGQECPGVSLDEVVTRIMRLWPMVYPNDAKTRALIASGGTPGPAE
jgi:hypothetical protein